MSDTLKKVDEKISHKEFFMGSWYQNGIKDLCTDGWPAFIVPVNMRINKMLNDLTQAQADIEVLRGALEKIARGESQFDNVDHMYTAREALAKVNRE